MLCLQIVRLYFKKNAVFKRFKEKTSTLDYQTLIK